MTGIKRFSTSEVGDIFNESDDDLSEMESESDTEFSFSETSESDDSTDTVTYDASSDFTWHDRQCDLPRRLKFTGSPGRKAAVSDVNDVLNYFRLFLTIEMLEMIVYETNRRAEQLSLGIQKPNSRLRKWVDVDQDELLVFIALLIYMGIIQKPEVNMYWSQKPLLETSYVRRIMSEERFSLIQKCLHFVNNSTLPETFSHRGERAFSKIKPFFSAVVHQFSTVYIPEQNVVIDESVMLCKDRVAVKLYNSYERVRFGLKSYELRECGSGYVWNSIVSTGRGSMELTASVDDSTSSQIVMTLAGGLLGKGYAVYMHSWYSSPALFRQLRMNVTDAIGPVQLNRKNMPLQLKKKIAKGRTVACFSTDLMALKWMDKREVNVLSTFHSNEMSIVQTHRGNKQKPIAVVTYNKNIGTADLEDQTLVAFPTERKVWYKKQFNHLLRQIVNNSYVLFKKDNPTTKINHLHFRIRLVERLLEVHHRPHHVPRKGRPSMDELNPLRLTERHFPESIPPSETRRAPTRCCKVCCSHSRPDGKKVRKETRYYCSDCNVGLCIVPCFKIYHTVLHF